MTVLFTMVAIQGFSKENDARWRRGFGGFGSLVTAFIFANTLDSDIFQALGYVFLGILGFGYGAMFSQRIGEEGEIYVADEQIQEAVIQATMAMPVVEKQSQSGLLKATNEIVAKKEEQLEIVEEVEEDSVIEESDDEVIEIEQPAPIIAPAEIQPIHNGLIETADGFAIRLPGDVVQNILNSINNTPHEGFKPVLGFSPSGQVMLNFETE